LQLQALLILQALVLLLAQILVPTHKAHLLVVVRAMMMMMIDPHLNQISSLALQHSLS
jgi:hypothetical protein